MGGRLKYFYDQWKKFTHDPFILDMVSGMSLDLTDVPQQSRLPHEIKMSQKESQVATEHVKTLLEKKAIIPTDFNPDTDFLSNVFLRPKPEWNIQDDT